jgi:flagellar biogenesis protein FliO
VPGEPGRLGEATAPGLATALPALGALVVLGAIALLLSRRRAASGRRLVQVLETASLGPKRQLVVARMGDQLLLLGSSEAGIALLSTQPAVEAAAVVGGAVEPRQPPGPAHPGNLISLWSRILGRPRGPAAPSFDDLLLETTDDLELRRKLASGRPGRVA